MMRLEWKPRTCLELLESYTSTGRNPQKLQFTDVGDRDVYNITAPFWNEGEWYLAGRVEQRDSEDSEVIFFTCIEDVWTPCLHLPRYQLQDPFITKIDEEWIMGGVELYFEPSDTEKKIRGWKTILYRGTTLHQLKHAGSGPWNMKDIRFIQMYNGEVGLFSRPFSVDGRVAVIGFSTVESFDILCEMIIINAKVFTDQFVKEEWGGANEVHLLGNGLLGVLGHISYIDEQGNRHYHSMTFALNPFTREKTKIKIIAVRSDFLPGPSKRPDLTDVIFSGGLIRQGNQRAMLYVGVGDAEAHCMDIEDPFTEYETINVQISDKS
ncbi:DUF1861 family protein [Paenibacillus shenyangensis]|uniref:DUF1861 family protein n=1 Tax=Paenibacillus sp. A9 TaxID=1284352 RepID=UPI000372F544|nr:DUF1861 family protein [Paenibacillus sp. A9]